MKSFLIKGNKLFAYSSVKLGYELIDEGEIQHYGENWFSVKTGKTLNCYCARDFLIKGPKAVNEVRRKGCKMTFRRGNVESYFDFLEGEKRLGMPTEFNDVYRVSPSEVAIAHFKDFEFIKMNDYHKVDGVLRYKQDVYRGQVMPILGVETHQGSRYFSGSAWKEIDTPFLTISLDDDGKTKTLLSVRIEGAYQVLYSCYCVKPLDSAVIEAQGDLYVLKRLNRETCEVEELGVCKEYRFNKVGDVSVLRFGEKSWKFDGEAIAEEWHDPEEIVVESGDAALLSHRNQEEIVPKQTGLYNFFRQVIGRIWNNLMEK